VFKEEKVVDKCVEIAIDAPYDLSVSRDSVLYRVGDKQVYSHCLCQLFCIVLSAEFCDK
jgi:hypothetical protein